MTKTQNRGWLILAIVSAILFLTDLGLVVSSATQAVDLQLERWVQTLNFGPLAYLFRATTWVSDLKQVIAVMIIIAVSWMIWRNTHQITQLAISWLSAAVIGEGVKILIDRPRPSSLLVHVLQQEQSKSFPSGHSIFYTWLGLSLILLLSPYIKPSGIRPLLWLLAVLLIFIGCLGRIWAGAHWPSDVGGGFLLALACMAGTLALTRGKTPTNSLR
ncbi:MAG: phosphatase PAP2 family protein [Candidatus Dormibacteraceae bacterium]